MRKHYRLTPDEVLEDFEVHHQDRESVMDFLKIDETTLERDQLLAKYEENIIERWYDVPFEREMEYRYEQLKGEY